MTPHDKYPKLEFESLEEINMERTWKNNEVVKTVFKAVAVAMSVAAIVLGALGTATTPTLISLLSIGLFCLAVASMQR
jgi:hypothetical protein